MSKAAPWEDDAPADTRAKAAPWEADAVMPPRPARARLPRLPNGQIDTNSPEFKAADIATRADMTREGGMADPTAGMNWGQKAIANIGAGMHDIVQGGAQRLHDLGITDSGPSGEDVAETRRLNEQLAERTRGGKVLQITGNALPLVAAGLIPGMQGIAGGAALGALGGALTPTGEGESAGTNTLIGGVLGGAVPLVLKGAGALWNKVSGRGAANAAAKDLTEAAAPDVEAAAAQSGMVPTPPARAPLFRGTPAATGKAGEQQQVAQALIDQLRGVQPTDVAGVRIPVSTGAALDNAGITRLETGSRIGNAANWADFKRQQAQAVADALRAATAEGEQFASRQGARADAWRQGMADAMANADQGELMPQIGILHSAIEGGKVSPEAMRPAVSSLYKSAGERLQSMGENLTPEHLMEARTALNEGFSSPEGRLTAKDAALSQLKQHYDTALDAITNGRTSDVVNAFRDASRGVDEAEAAQAVRQAFFTPEGRAATTRAFGDVPTITEARLRQFIKDQARPQRYGGGSYLSDTANQDLNALLDTIVKNKNVEQLNRIAAPEGSATAANLAAQKATEFAGNTLRQVFEAKAGPLGKLVTGTVDVLGNANQIRRDAAMARALQDPQYMAELLQQYNASLGPTSRKAEAVAQALRSLSVEGGTAATRK